MWSMQRPNGRKMYFTGKFTEVKPMERLVYTDGMSDENGNLMSAEMMGMPAGTPVSMDVTVTFAYADGKTTVTVSHMSQGEGDGAAMGWEQAFDKLEAVLA